MVSKATLSFINIFHYVIFALSTILYSYVYCKVRGTKVDKASIIMLILYKIAFFSDFLQAILDGDSSDYVSTIVISTVYILIQQGMLFFLYEM